MTGQSAMTLSWRDVERYLALAGGLTMIFFAFVYAINGAPVFRSDLEYELQVRDLRLDNLRAASETQSKDLKTLVEKVNDINEGQARIEENLQSVAKGIDRLEGRN